MLVSLWTFENKKKLSLFAKVLTAHELPFEVQSSKKLANSEGLTIAVEEDLYDDARRLLMRYRKSKTGTHGSVTRPKGDDLTKK